MASDSYPDEGIAWADFLHHRSRVIVEMIEEDKSPQEVARILSMDPRQVALIYWAMKGPRP